MAVKRQTLLKVILILVVSIEASEVLVKFSITIDFLSNKATFFITFRNMSTSIELYANSTKIIAKILYAD